MTTTPPSPFPLAKLRQERPRTSLLGRWLAAFDEHGITWEQVSGPLLWLPQVNMWAVLEVPNVPAERLLPLQGMAERTGFPCLLLIGEPRNRGYYALEPEKNAPCWHEEEYQGHQFRAMDYWPFDGNDYHLSESRFYSCGAGSDFHGFPRPKVSGIHAYNTLTQTLTLNPCFRGKHEEAAILACPHCGSTNLTPPHHVKWRPLPSEEAVDTLVYLTCQSCLGYLCLYIALSQGSKGPLAIFWDKNVYVPAETADDLEAQP